MKQNLVALNCIISMDFDFERYDPQSWVTNNMTMITITTTTTTTTTTSTAKTTTINDGSLTERYIFTFISLIWAERRF